MQKILVIANREISSFFDSLIAYVMIILFLGLSGSFTWLFGTNVFILGQANLQVFFSIAFWSLFFFIPAITMRMIAEENKTGTIELLLTKSITHFEIVMGKFIACLVLVLVALLCTIPYYITMSQIGNVDTGAVFGGYLGLIMLSSVYIGIGLFASSITQNQIVAFLLSLSIGIFFQMLFDVMGSGSTGFLGEIINFLSLREHFDSLSRGVVDSRDIIYFISLTAVSLYATQVMITKRNWK